MKPNRTIKELNASILLLETRRELEFISLKEQYKATYESLKPLNLIKNTFKDLTSAPDFKEDLINASISLASGYFSKKIAIGTTNNPFKQLVGSLLQMGVTAVVAKNADGIRTKFIDVVSLLIKKKED